MTVNNSEWFSGPYYGNGVTTDFPFTFEAMTPAEVAVAVDDVPSPNGYAVTLAPGGAGGTVRFVVPPLNGVRVVPFSNPSFLQKVSFQNAGKFLPETHDGVADLDAIRDIYLLGQLDRTLRAPVGETLDPLPPSDEREGMYIAFDAEGNPIASHGTGADLGLREDLAEDTGASLVGDDGGSRWQSVAEFIDYMDAAMGTPLTPEMFGAVGDGVTNDSDAFTALAAAVNAADGGAILIPPKTYIVGKQVFAGATGLEYAYKMQDMLNFIDCQRPVVIDLQGKIRMVSGLKFGSFDPVTGAVIASSNNEDHQASLGFMISANNCSGGMYIFGGGELDGNMDGAILGGSWGDTGRQIAAYGVYYLETRGVCADVHVHHTCLDGLAVVNTYAAAMPAKPVRFERCRSLYNARQGLTWAGGRGVTCIGCEFASTGRGRFGSSPGAGVDIEPDGSSLSVDGLFIDCVFANNIGVGLVTDTVGPQVYDIRCIGCHFYGTVGGSYCVWPDNPGFTFDNCTFSGAALGNFISDRPANRTQFLNCLFKPVTYQGLTPYVAGVGLFDFSVSVVAKNCTFDNGNDPGIRLGASVATAEFHDCTFHQSNCALGALVSGTFYGHNHFQMDSGSQDFSGSSVRGYVTGAGAGTFLSIAMVNGHGGALSPAYQAMQRIGGNSGTFQLNVTYGTYANPMTTFSGNTWARGDFMWNTEPVAGGPYGWICTVAGTPGTWVPMGVNGAVQAGAFADIVGAPTQAHFNALLALLRTAKVLAP